MSLIEGEVEVLEIDVLPQERGDRFVAPTGFDPCALAPPYRWVPRLPRRIQVWREMSKLLDRELGATAVARSHPPAGGPRPTPAIR